MTIMSARYGGGLDLKATIWCPSIIFGRVTHRIETTDHAPCWGHILPWVPGAPLFHKIAPPVN
jgi:hypothetical protein